jgi:hypothetical protein
MMKSITAISGGISFKIWLLALITNTIGGSFILAGIKPDALLYAMIGGFFGAIFSFPVFLIVWKILYHLFKKKYSHTEVLAGLLVLAIVMATLAYGLFSLIFPMGRDGTSLLFMAIISGCTGVVLSYGNIRKYCDKRDALEQTLLHIGQPENIYNS